MINLNINNKIRKAIIVVCGFFMLSYASFGFTDELYLLGDGDTVHITVYGQTDLTTDARISPEGKIPYPLLGEVNIGGLSAEAAAARIAQKLKSGGFIKAPQVAVSVKSYLSQQVSILGQIHKPGNYSLEGKVKILDLLAKAGGVTPEAADVIVLVKKAIESESVRHEIDLKKFYEGDMSLNMQMSSGDVILVPKMDTFFVYGEIRKPGMYRLEREMTVMQALSVGGGVNERGSHKGLKVNRRQANGEMKKIKVKLTEKLMPDDVLYVKERLF